MADINKVILIGNLGSEPEFKATRTGKSFVTFTLATAGEWRDDEGQSQKKTEWHKIITFGKIAEKCLKYISKGSKVYLEGRIQTNQWETEAGEKRKSFEIVARELFFL